MFSAGRDKRQSTALEIIGPPGSGKSTILQALCDDMPAARPLSIYCTPRNLPLWVRSSLRLMPKLRKAPSHEAGRWRTRRWMIRLKAAEGILARERKRSGLLLFDQGPVYTLACLKEVMKTMPSSSIVWEPHSISFWAEALDAVIILDAPDDLLLDRIHGRSKPHALRAVARGRARWSLNEERGFYEETVTELIEARDTLPIIRFDTSKIPVEGIIARLRPTLGSPELNSGLGHRDVVGEGVDHPIATQPGD